MIRPGLLPAAREAAGKSGPRAIPPESLTGCRFTEFAMWCFIGASCGALETDKDANSSNSCVSTQFSNDTHLLLS